MKFNKPVSILLTALLTAALLFTGCGTKTNDTDLGDAGSEPSEITVPEGRPLPFDPDDEEISDEEYTCTISISCATILSDTDRLDPEKLELLPEDGYILAPTEVKFYGGESVFNILRRTCKENKLHLEFTNTPIYGSAYIEGIGNIYEFDCGELSGWMYRVNDWFPNYGCSRYRLQDKDVVEFVYTCDLGKDVGGDYLSNRDTE